MMTKYDESYKPPAPIAQVQIRKIENGKRVKNISVLLDTGADISLLPRQSVESLEIKPLLNESFNLEGFYGVEKSAKVYYFQVIFLNKRFTGNYCLIDEEIGILGRDILNQLSILFDGNNLVWKEKK